MVRRVTASVDVDASGARKGAQDTEQSAGRIAGAFDGLKAKAGNAREALAGFGDKIGGMAREKLGPLGDAADKAGIDLERMGPAGMVAGAALAGLGATVLGGIDKFRTLAANVKQFQSAAGLGAEEASRLAAVFGQFGIEAEDGADVLKTMGEIIGTDADKFKTYGVEIAKARDGTVDMSATLGNVAQRFAEMQDPAQRAALGSELFGDSWVKIAPVLQGGRAELERLLAAVDDSAVITEDGIKQADEYQRALSKLSEQWSKAQIEIGREALPEIIEGLENLTAAMNAVNEVADKVGGLGRIKDAFDTLTSPIEQVRRAYDHVLGVWRRTREDGDAAASATVDLATGMGELALAAGPAARQAEDLAIAEREAARAAEEQARKTADTVSELKALEEAVDAAAAAQERAAASVVTAFESQNRYEQAQRATAEAMAGTTTAAEALATATNEHGAESEQATKAQGDYSRALEDAQQKVYSQAQAAVDLAQKQAEVSGATLTTAEANQVYRDRLVEARDATNDPVLKQALDTKISQYDEFSVKANSTATGVAEASTKLADAKTAVADPALGEALDTAAGKFGGLATAAWAAADGMAAAAVRAAANFTPALPTPVAQESGDPASLQRFEGQRAGGFAMQRSAGSDAGAAAGPTVVINTPIGPPDAVIRWVREELRRLERADR